MPADASTRAKALGQSMHHMALRRAPQPQTSPATEDRRRCRAHGHLGRLACATAMILGRIRDPLPAAPEGGRSVHRLMSWPSFPSQYPLCWCRDLHVSSSGVDCCLIPRRDLRPPRMPGTPSRLLPLGQERSFTCAWPLAVFYARAPARPKLGSRPSETSAHDTLAGITLRASGLRFGSGNAEGVCLKVERG